MANDFIVPGDGDILVSPTTEYYKGAPLQHFLEASFKPRLSRLSESTPSVEINLYVCGAVNAFNQYHSLHLDLNRGNEPSNERSYNPVFKAAHPKDARQAGFSRTNNWVFDNKKHICKATDNALKAYSLKPRDILGQRTEVTYNENEFFHHYDGYALSLKDPYLSVRIHDMEGLRHEAGSEQDNFFINAIAITIAHIQHGQEIARKANESERQRLFNGTDFPADSTYCKFEDIATSTIDIPYLCDALSIDTTTFNSALECAKVKLEQDNAKDIKACAVYIRIVAAAYPYFDRKTLQVLVKNKLASQPNKNGLQKAFVGSMMHSITEFAYFLLFKGNILYAEPQAIDTMQSLLSGVAGILFGRHFSFPVQIKEKETSSSPEQRSRTPSPEHTKKAGLVLSNEDAKLLHAAKERCKTGALSEDAFFLFLEQLTKEVQPLTASPGIKSGLFNQAPITTEKGKGKVSFASYPSQESFSGSIRNDSTGSTPQGSPPNNSSSALQSDQGGQGSSSSLLQNKK